MQKSKQPVIHSVNQNNLSRYQLSINNLAYQIYIARDGDIWCALLGTSLQDGFSGFGSSLPEALHDLANKIAN